MTRIIKRYGSRKLYDTLESRYVSLDELTVWVRKGEEIQVVDNASGEDVTVMTLTQIISEEGRKGEKFLPTDLLHDLIRFGNTAVGERVKKLQTGVDRFVKSSLGRIAPMTTVRDEVQQLRMRLDELELALSQSPGGVELKPPLVIRQPAPKTNAGNTSSPKVKSNTSKTEPKARVAKGTAVQPTNKKSAAKGKGPSGND